MSDWVDSWATASGSCRRSTRSSWAAACSRSTSSSGPPSSRTRAPPPSFSDGTRTPARWSTRALPPRPAPRCLPDARRHELADRADRPRPRLAHCIHPAAGQARLRGRRPRPGRRPDRCPAPRRAPPDRAPVGAGRREGTLARRQALALVDAAPMADGRVRLAYRPMRPADFDAAIIGEFRARRRAGRRLARGHGALAARDHRRQDRPAPHHPAAYRREADRLYVIASAGSTPAHPAWYLNLRGPSRCHRGGRDGAVRGDRDRAGGRGPRPRVRRHRQRQPGGGRLPGDDRAHDPGGRPRPEALGLDALLADSCAACGLSERLRSRPGPS